MFYCYTMTLSRSAGVLYLEAEELSSKDRDGAEKWGDWALFAAAVLAAIPFVLGNVVICIYRKRRYFRTEGVDLILGSSGAGLIWIMASFVVNQHFKREKMPFKLCPIWTFWLQLCFGFCLWLVCLAMRLHRLFLLCTQQENLSTWAVWLKYVPLLLLPAIIFSAVATKYAVVHYEEDTDTCLIRDNRWKLCSFLVVPPLYFSLIVLLALRLRTQTDFIVSTEFRHTIEYAVLTFVIYLLMGTTYANGKQGLVPGRVFLTFCVCSLVFSHFWVRMGYPVYLCLLKPASAMDSFEEELRMSGARCLETIRMFSLINNRNRTGRVDSMQWPVDGLGLIRAIEGTKKEAAELKAKAKQLEVKKNQVEKQVNLLLAQRSLQLEGDPSTELSEGNFSLEPMLRSPERS